MKNLVKNIKSLPVRSKKLLGLGIVLALTIALPLFVWAVLTQRLDLRKRASTAELPVEIIVIGRPGYGPDDAPVDIVMFTDFQCPSCKAFHDQTFDNLLNLYPDKIRFIVKHFPLSSHPQAENAAVAAECAFEQNKFWEMQDLLFQNQDTLSDAIYQTLATQLSLDLTQFDTCVSDPNTLETILSDKTEGESLAITGTPTFFIDEHKLIGAQPLSSFQTIIDNILSIPTFTPTASPTQPPTSCGGYAGTLCPAGYVCVYGNGSTIASYPDELGTCQTGNTRTSLPTPSGSPSPSPTLSPTSPPPTVRGFSIDLKLAGVNDDSAEGAKVIFGFLSRTTGRSMLTTSPVILYHVADGVYRAMFGISSNLLPTANDYSIFVKGEKHLSSRFCHDIGQNQRCPSSQNGSINIPDAVPGLLTQVFNFTGLSLEPGDLYIQDGKTDGNDFQKVKDLMNKSCSELTSQELLQADLNYDGCVTVLDAFLIRRTLETRYDE